MASRILIIVTVVIIILLAFVGFLFLLGAFSTAGQVSINGLTLDIDYPNNSKSNYFGPVEQYTVFSEKTYAGGHFDVTITITNLDKQQSHGIYSIEPSSTEFLWVPGYRLSPIIETQDCERASPEECSAYEISPGESVSFTLEISALCLEFSMFGKCSAPSYTGSLTFLVTTNS
jgi:hypothetical protein